MIVTQNLNLRTNLKLEYDVKAQLYRTELFYMISDLKVIKLENDCVTLQFALVL